MGRKFFFSLFTFGRVLYSLQPLGKGQAVVFFGQNLHRQACPRCPRLFAFRLTAASSATNKSEHRKVLTG